MSVQHQRFTCMFESCALREFKTKYAWKKHLLKDHRTAIVPQYMCELCALSFSAVDRYPDREDIACLADMVPAKSPRKRSPKVEENPPLTTYAPNVTTEFFDFSQSDPMSNAL